MFLKKYNEDTEYMLHGNCEFLAAELNKRYGYTIEAAIALYDIEELSDEMTLEEFLNLSYDEYNEKYMENDFDKWVPPTAQIIHCYNTFIKDGVKYYVDARGITSNEESFFSIYNEASVMIYREYSTAEELKTKNISTYYDWYGDSEFLRKTLEHRVIPAELYVETYPELFVL